MFPWITIVFFVLFTIFLIKFAYDYTLNAYLQLCIIILITMFIYLTIIEEYNTPYIPTLNPRRYPLNSIPYLNSLEESKEYIDKSLQIASYEFNNPKSKSDSQIIEAMNHSVKGGKRLRSALMINIAQQSTKEYVDPTEMALCLEYLHGASLIIDDMPHFDNDDLRRNNISTHKKYGLAVSQMASTSLTAEAMECLVRQGDKIKDSKVTNKLISLISNCSGINGLAGGQLKELTSFKDLNDVDGLDDIIKRKTSSLFEAAIMSGWLIGTSTWKTYPNKVQNLLIKQIANHYGKAFQIADDIQDQEKDMERGQGHINYSIVYGEIQSMYQIKEELTQCCSKLKTLGLWSPVWLDAFKLIY